LETPLINGKRDSMELEQLLVKTNADETIWLKILYFLAAVYPILRENGKCKCNWKTVGWSIVPFVFTIRYINIIIVYATLQKVLIALAYVLHLLLALSLSYSRKRCSDAIVGEENRLYINTVAKRGVMLSLIGGVICGVIFGANSVSNGSFNGMSVHVVSIAVFQYFLLSTLTI
jgi:hypothetical protein